jgi:type I restriction enzyme S subunit
MFYKETEFQETKTGKIPSNWQAAVLSELSEHITKGTTPTTLGFSYKSSGINFIKVESIDDHGNFVPENVPHISKEANSALSRSVLKEKDILFSIAGALGRVALVTEKMLPANTNQALSIVRVKEKEKILPEYLKYFLMGPNIQGFVKSIAIQSQQANLNLEQIRDFRVGLPSLSEQKAIVGVLGVVDSALELADRVIAKTEQVKKGLMQQLLTCGIGHTEYKQTSMGKIPKEWQVFELKDVSEVTDGSHWSPKEIEKSDYKIATVANMGDNQIDIESCKSISKEDFERLIRTGDVPAEGDILFSKDGTIGVSFAFQQQRHNIGLLSSIAIIKPNRKVISPQFGSYALKSPKVFRQIMGWKTGTAIGRITIEHLNVIRIPVPALSEQKEIAQILSITDTKLELERKEKRKLEYVREGLMNLLLTGKVRIKVD